MCIYYYVQLENDEGFLHLGCENQKFQAFTLITLVGNPHEVFLGVFCWDNFDGPPVKYVPKMQTEWWGSSPNLINALAANLASSQ
jgi:hypothetical protein